MRWLLAHCDPESAQEPCARRMEWTAAVEHSPVVNDQHLADAQLHGLAAGTGSARYFSAEPVECLGRARIRFHGSKPRCEQKTVPQARRSEHWHPTRWRVSSLTHFKVNVAKRLAYGRSAHREDRPAVQQQLSPVSVVRPLASPTHQIGVGMVRVEWHSVRLAQVGIVALVKRGSFEGTASELLQALNDRRGDDQPPKDWPKNYSGMSAALRRLAPNLRAIGMVVELPERGQGRDKRRVIRLELPGDQRAARAAGGDDDIGDGGTRRRGGGPVPPGAGQCGNADDAARAARPARTQSNRGDDRWRQ